MIWRRTAQYYPLRLKRWNASSAAVSSKKFADTLLLPKTTFPLRQKNIKRFQQRTCEQLYDHQWKNAPGDLFVFIDGPPYANGDLHIGHALNKILKDIINRYHVIRGRRVLYHPGWDCHGLPIENKALQELKKDSTSLSPTVIRKAAKATAEREVASQRAQFQQLAIMANWSQETTYRTMDHDYEIRQLKVFKRMVERGLIYRHHRPVYFSPSSRSALAEAELLYKDDHVSHSVYVTFVLDNCAKLPSKVQGQKVELLVWTTTPWTLTANMGIAVNPLMLYTVVRPWSQPGRTLVVGTGRLSALEDIIGPVEELGHILGSDLVGSSYAPIFNASSSHRLPVVPAKHVTADSGTGLVHCAPSHGAEDYLTFKQLGLIKDASSMICHVDGAGNFGGEISDVIGAGLAARLIGKDVLGDGSKAIVEILKEAGSLVKLQRIKHRYPYDWKTDKPVIVTATSQWFANLDDIKDNALEALRAVNFVPAPSRNRLESFTRTRSEWCISRQRAWGVPIPALHNIATGEAILDSNTLDHILPILEKKGVQHWWDGPVDEFVPPSLLREGDPPANEIWRKDTDTMDVWFDSGTSWSMQGVGKDLRRFEGRRYYADVCLEGTDQHRGWFQSQLLTSVGCTPNTEKPFSPYGTLITHGMVLDQEGKKMSKSLGNIISPMTVVNGGTDKKKDPIYGADVLRLWVASVDYWHDMSIGPRILNQVEESIRKIRNSARFILGNIGDAQTRSRLGRIGHGEMGLAERYVMGELYKVEQTALDGYASYNFPKVVNALTRFTNITLSSLYFDITKDCLYANSLDSLERRAAVTTLEQILKTVTSIIAPIVPHLAEEIHESLGKSEGSVFNVPWNPLSSEWADNQAEKDMNTLLSIRPAVLGLLEQARSDKLLKSSLEAEVDIILPSHTPAGHPMIDLLRREEHFLKTLFITSDATITEEGSVGTKSSGWVYSKSLTFDFDLDIRIRSSSKEKCPRCWSYTRLEDHTLCDRCSHVLHTS